MDLTDIEQKTVCETTKHGNIIIPERMNFSSAIKFCKQMNSNIVKTKTDIIKEELDMKSKEC